MTTIISSSDFGVLHLTTAEYIEYLQEQKNLFKKFYLKQRAARGIWASNQNKFVSRKSELNELDSRYEENNYATGEQS